MCCCLVAEEADFVRTGKAKFLLEPSAPLARSRVAMQISSSIAIDGGG